MYEAPVIAWIAAVVLAGIVWAFCGYEVSWKARRLRRDLDRLTATRGQLDGLRHDALAARARILAAAVVAGRGAERGPGAE